MRGDDWIDLAGMWIGGAFALVAFVIAAAIVVRGLFG